MSISSWIEAVGRQTAARLGDRARSRRRTGARGIGARGGAYRVEGLERRVFLSSAIAAFAAQQTFSTGQARSIALADVNRDGKPDLIVANSGGGGHTVGVLLGNGDGTFQAQQTFATGSFPISVVAADVNKDGKPDLVVANNTNSGSVSVLLGNGNGTFQAQHTFATGANPRTVAVADVNGDGTPDLLVANYGGGGVGVLLGNGDGTFQAQQTFTTGTNPQAVSAADVNGDGKLDLIVANSGSNSVSVLLGNGTGTFQGQQTFTTGSFPVSIVASDLNGDGKPDLVLANQNGGGVSVLLGNGNGTFQAQQALTVGTTPVSVAVGDVNGDGRPDLVVANSDSNSVSVLLGSASGNFTGQVYTIVPSLDTITGTAGIDQITLVQNPDHTHIDWTLGATTAQLSINDPNGLTINGNGSNDVVTLDYTNGNPLPNTLHLNGTFTVNNLSATNPLANTTLELGRSTVFIHYSSSDPLALIQGYLKNGYNNGAWNGTPTASTGVITSTPARTNPNHNTAIGYADSADGTGYNTTANSIELKYTLYGDTNLDGSVAFLDFSSLAANYNVPSNFAWDQGSFDYSGSVNFNSFSLLAANYNTNLGSQVTPAAAATPISSTVTAPTADRTKVKLAVQVKPPHQSALQHRHTAKRQKKHR